MKGDEGSEKNPYSTMFDKTLYDDKAYNSSIPSKFYALMQDGQFWKDINFIVSHGKFMRRLVSLVTKDIFKALKKDKTEEEIQKIKKSLEKTEETLEKIKSNNLFIVKLNVNNKTFYMVRHCARKFQGMGLLGGERSRKNGDPVCKRTSANKICNQATFENEIQSLMTEVHINTVGVFSSCMRRSTETAKVIADTISPFLKKNTLSVHVLPFCRETKNWLFIFDFLNNCSASTLENLRTSQVTANNTGFTLGIDRV